MACLTVNVLLWEVGSLDKRSDQMQADLPYSTDGMSLTGGPMFDPILQYFYQNSVMGGCGDEEQSLSYVPELRIEVPDFKL